ncbi:MAG: glycosyltransferase family 2 protein [Candidatus Levybacteria bacterium]|nr:glycosyltransferase family 2 protein [Candidatus Levybacteria bacterium]
MLISFVIPNFNGEGILKKNLPRIIEAAGKFTKGGDKIQIILVDDCSSDNSVPVIKEIFNKYKEENMSFRLLESDVNRGFSSTVNRGAKEARGEILILLNTDVYPETNKDFFSHALRYFDDPNHFAVGFMDKSIEENGNVVLRGRGVGKWKRGFLLHRRGEVDRKNTLWVSGGSSVFRKAMWDELGGMWEDIDLSYRAQKHGYTIAFEPKCVLIHEHEKGAIKKSRSHFSVQVISYRNQVQFVWLNVTDTSLFLSHICWLPFHVLNTLSKGDFAFLLGFFSALVRLPVILQRRAQNRKRNVVPDKEILDEFVTETIA